jgi:hypothetical protein
MDGRFDIETRMLSSHLSVLLKDRQVRSFPGTMSEGPLESAERSIKNLLEVEAGQQVMKGLQVSNIIVCLPLRSVARFG